MPYVVLPDHRISNPGNPALHKISNVRNGAFGAGLKAHVSPELASLELV